MCADKLTDKMDQQTTSEFIEYKIARNGYTHTQCHSLTFSKLAAMFRNIMKTHAHSLC